MPITWASCCCCGDCWGRGSSGKNLHHKGHEGSTKGRAWDETRSTSTYFWRERFAIGPNRAIGEVFFFPDRNSSLKSIDEPAAGVEGGGAMAGINRYEHAALANLQAA